MTEQDIINAVIIAKEAKYDINRFVLNLTDSKLYSSQTKAAPYYNIKHSHNIGDACRHETKIGKCYWMFYTDYLKENSLTDDEARKSLFFVE